MKQSFNLRFYARRCKVSKGTGLCPLELAVNINGTRRFINLPYKTTPDEFARKRQPKELTDYMALMRERVNEILTDMLRNGEPVTTQAIIEYVRTGGYKSYTVNDLFNEFLDIKRAQLGKNLSKGVYRKYELVRDLFFAFINPDKECSTQLTPSAVMKFKAYVEEKYEQATAAGYLRKLKSAVQFAIDNNRISVNPFQNIRITRGSKDIVYLKKWEQEALISTRLDNKSMERVRDFAVFQLSTGMAYADLKDFRKSDVKVSHNGVRFIQKPRHKTGKVFTAVILQPGLDVLDKYDGELPVLTNQKYNAFLKAVQEFCGIETKLTTHLFRRTYATNLINAGIRIETVAAALGHDQKTCARYYAHLQDSTVIDEISRVI